LTPTRNPVFVDPTDVNPAGIKFQFVGGVTLDGMQPKVTCPKVRLVFEVFGCGTAVVFWFTCADAAVAGAPTLTSVQVPRSVEPLNRCKTTHELIVPVQPLPDATLPVETPHGTPVDSDAHDDPVLP
jgi:hypothetical protein